MTGPRLAVVGGLALDNVITARGERFIGRAGGNSLWSALGAAMFGAPVGIVARAGSDYPSEVLAGVAAAGVDTSGIIHTGRPQVLRIAYQHLPDGRRLQPVPAETVAGLPEPEQGAFRDSTVDPDDRAGGDPAPADLPGAWLAAVRGWHLPLVPLAAHRELVRALRSNPDAVVTADCPNRHELGDLFGDLAPTLSALDVFLPSSSDLEVIDPSLDAADTARRLATAGGTPVVMKLGASGALVVTDRGEWHIPALRVRSVDPTGAGDAFCGAFLAAFTEDRDPVRAAVYGTVAGSFAVEAAHALELAGSSAGERDARLAEVTRQLTPHSMTGR